MGWDVPKLEILLTKADYSLKENLFKSSKDSPCLYTKINTNLFRRSKDNAGLFPKT